MYILSCINKCDSLKNRLANIKVKENQPEINLVDLPTEIQDKIMMNMNCLKDLESMSEATPFLTQIAAEYEKVRSGFRGPSAAPGALGDVVLKVFLGSFGEVD